MILRLRPPKTVILFDVGTAIFGRSLPSETSVFVISKLPSTGIFKNSPLSVLDTTTVSPSSRISK